MKIFLHKCNICPENDFICLAEPYRSWYNEMDEAKKLRCDRIKAPIDRILSISGDHLARLALEEQTGSPAEKFHFSYDSHNKPILPDGSAYFNISHSGSFAVAIAAEKPCGIDIEVPRKIRTSVIDRVCTAEEKEFIENSPNKALAFLTVWTKKEAYFKSIGCGIATVLSFFNTLCEQKIVTLQTNDYVLSLYPQEKKEDIHVITK